MKSKQEWYRRPSFVVFVLTSAAMIFVGGGIFALKDWQPFKAISDGYGALVQVMSEQGQPRSKLLQARRYSQHGVVAFREAQAYRGVTLMQGIFDEVPSVRLIDMDGRQLHEWKVDLFKIFSRQTDATSADRWPKSHFNYHTQGVVALQDGSIIVALGNYGAARLDWCSDVIWAIPVLAHHSVTADPEGGYWLAANRAVSETPGALFMLGFTRGSLEKTELARYDQILVRVRDNGQVDRQISVLEALVGAGLEREIYRAMIADQEDPTHLNDIEIVTDQLAAKLPGVHAGDLLASLRNMDMLVILDRDTGKLLWHQSGPWIRQHDPDIDESGNIVLYNNAVAGFSLGRIPGSNIMKLNPGTGETEILYPKKRKEPFFSDIMGTHQLLPNGNMLIAESRAGRVFEIDPDGNIVWEYFQQYVDEEFAALIEVAERYPENFFKRLGSACGTPAN